MVGFRWKFFRAWSHTVWDYKLITDYLHSRQYILSMCVKRFLRHFFISIFPLSDSFAVSLYAIFMLCIWSS